MSKSDIQIAREAKMDPINEVLAKINIPDDPTAFSPMGRHVAKINFEYLETLKNKNARGQIINIGTGKPRKIKNIIEHIKKVSKGGYPQFGKIKLRKDEILKIYPNIKKAKNVINWRPKISFKKGLKSTIKFYNEQAIQQQALSQCNNELPQW